MLLTVFCTTIAIAFGWPFIQQANYRLSEWRNRPSDQVLPADQFIHTDDPALLAAITPDREVWTPRVPGILNAKSFENAAAVDRGTPYPGGGGHSGVWVGRRTSPGGTVRDIIIATDTTLTPGDSKVVDFTAGIQTPATWTLGSRRKNDWKWGDHIFVGYTQTLTLYMPQRSTTDPALITMRYSLTGASGDIAIRLGDDGALGYTVLSGPLELIPRRR